MNTKMKKAICKLVARLNENRIDWLAFRAENAEHIASLADENGKVCVLESGRDCDGVVYSGQKTVIPANVMAFEKLDAELGEWADGPYYLTVVSTSEMEEIEYTSRDTFAEAAGY